MAYCGYVEFLMVIMMIVLMFLMLFLCICLMMMNSNVNLWVFSEKIFSNYFFGDLEIIISVWSLLFLCMVIFISSSVMVFSFSYMSSLMVSNFIFLYVSFVFSMVWLVISGNFYWLMLGWDGLGVVSFLLILFYMNYESINNGLFTLFQNRIGDLFFVFFILGSINLNVSLNVFLKFGISFLILGACVKSAQFPFNAWLLSAMSAPTPISSLVHSSTLVVAGVYILLQYHYCLISELWILKYIAILTLLISMFGLMNEVDMKKLIAYSTMSHVGLMMFMLSMQLFKIVYFHLNVHAMFKSLMFMCFGFVMLSSYHGQDYRLISLYDLNPLIKVVYYFSCFCLLGLPFLSGFFSKDYMIEKMMESVNEFVWIFLLLCFLSVSIYYSMKLMQVYFKSYSYSLMELHLLGKWSVMLMVIVMVVFINIFLSLMLSLTMEIVSMKLFIYSFMFFFFLLSILFKFNYKFVGYEKWYNFKEIWYINFYMLDQYMFWNIHSVFNFFSFMSFYKIFIFMNWWVVSLSIFIF